MTNTAESVTRSRHLFATGGLLRVFVVLTAGLVWSFNAAALNCTASFAGGDWSNPAHWSCGVVPGPGDTASINVGLGNTFNYSSAASTTVTTFRISSGTLTFSAPGPVINASSNMDFQGGAIGPNAHLSTTGNANVTGTFTNNGTVEVAALDNGLLAVNGTFVQGSTGTLRMTGNVGSPKITLAASGAGNTVIYAGAGTLIEGGTYHNLTLLADFSFRTRTLNGNVTVNGDLRIEQGTLDEGGTFALVGGPGTLYAQNGGSLRLSTSTSIPTFGTFDLLTGCAGFSGSEIEHGPAGGAAVISTLPSYCHVRLFNATTGTAGPGNLLDIDGNLNISFDSQLNLNDEVVDLEGNLDGSGTLNFGTSSAALDIAGDAAGCGECSSTSLTGVVGVNYDGLAGQLINTSDYNTISFAAGSSPDFMYGYAPYGMYSINVGTTMSMFTGSKVDLDYGGITFDGGGTASFSMQGTSELFLGDGEFFNPTGCGGLGCVEPVTSPFPQNFASYSIAPTTKVTYDAAVDQFVETAYNYGDLTLTSVCETYSYYGGSALRSSESLVGGDRAGSAGRRRGSSREDAVSGHETPRPQNAPCSGTFSTIKTLDGALSIQGSLEVLDFYYYVSYYGPVDSTTTLDTNGNPVTTAGDIFVDVGATFQTSGATVTAGGDVTIEGFFPSPGTLVMTGADGILTTYQDLLNFSPQANTTVNTADTSVRINGALNLGTSVLTVTGPGALILSDSATTSTIGGYITPGVIQEFATAPSTKTVPVGAGGFSAPVTFSVNSFTSVPPGSVSVSGQLGHPQPGVPAGSLNFTWDITPSNINSADVIFEYDEGLVQGFEPGYAPYRWDGFAWVPVTPFTLDPVNNVVTVPNVTQFSPWTLFQADTPPTAAADTEVTPEDVPGTFNVLTNDFDAEGPVTISGNTQGANGSVTCTTTDCTYTPNANFNGSDSFTYTIQDTGGFTASSTVNVTVNPVNDAPTFAATGNVSVAEDSGPYSALWASSISPGPAEEISQNVFFNVSNDNNVLFSAPPSIDPSGNLTFTPAADAFGTANVTVSLSDDGGTANGGSDTSAPVVFTITITALNDAPVAVDDTSYLTSEDTPLTEPVTSGVLVNDADRDQDPLTAILVTDVSNGTLALSPDGSFTYTPNQDFNGTDFFTYKANDGTADSNVASVFISVTPVNDPPVAVDDTANAVLDTPVTINVQANDFDVDGDPFNFSGWTQGTNGSVSCSGTDCIYSPNPGFFGTDSFTYTISDPFQAFDTATVTVTVADSVDVDLVVTKTGPAFAQQTTDAIFTVTITNNGPGTAFNVVVADPTPAGAVFVSNSGVCSTPYPCIFSSMQAGETKSITSKYTITRQASGLLSNTASVSTDSNELAPLDNSSTASLTVCPAAPFDLIPGGGVEVATSGVLSWVGSSATTFEVYLGKVGQPKALIGSTSGSSFNYSDLDPSSAYEWRVDAIRSGCPIASATASFRTAPPDCASVGPELLTPAPGASVEIPVTFSWTAVDGAVAYRVYASVDGGAEQLLIETVATTATDVVVPPGDISWRVEAILEGSCPAVSSGNGSFLATGVGECSELAPTIVSPVDGTTGLQSPVNFVWNAVPGATKYRVWVGAQDQFPVLVGQTTSTSLTASVPSGTLTWYVQALFDGCPPNISSQATIIVDQSANCPTARPVALSPNDTTESGLVTFDWEGAPGVVRYAVWASIDGDTPSVIGTVDGTETSFTRELDPGVIEWFVEAFFDGCPSTTSNVSAFVNLELVVCPTAEPLQLSPADGAVGVDPLVRFSWTEVDEAEGYRVLARSNGVGEFEVIASTLADTSALVPVEGSFIEWIVEAVFVGCDPTFSGVQSFEVEDVSCSSESSVLIAPAPGVVLNDSTVELSWSAVDGATAYEVFVRRSNGAASLVGLTDGLTTDLEVELDEGDQIWWVDSLFGGNCPETTSARGTFTIDIPSSEACETSQKLLLVSPRQGARSILSPVIFEWTEISGADGYRLTLIQDGDVLSSTIRPTNQAVLQLGAGPYSWYVEALRPGCPPIRSIDQSFRVLEPQACQTVTRRPVVFAPPKVAVGTEYKVSWRQVRGATVYEVQESRVPDSFRGAPVTAVRGTSVEVTKKFSDLEPVGRTRFYYRVRAITDCNGEYGPYSRVAGVVIDGSSADAADGLSTETEDVEGGFATIELNKDALSLNVIEEFTITLRSSTDQPETVRIVPDQDWLTVEPEVVTLTPGGVEVLVRADMSGLPLGANGATFTLEPVDAGGVTASQGTTVPVSVSLVTPVSGSGKSEPLPESLIIPAVAHADGINSTWLSDIRLSNVGATTQKYQLNFTPSGANATNTGQTTSVDVKAGETVALNDLLANWFGAIDEDQSGVLEIRPLSSSTSASIGGLTSNVSSGSSAIASSRTYNFTPEGTFGQFIPAVSFSKFVGGGDGTTPAPVLSMQQVSQSDAFRTNLGLVEGSGNATSSLVTVYSASGSQLGQFTVELQAGEHVQLNSVLAENGISVENGRITVESQSGEGKLTAYASVVDNRTNDPQLVPGQLLSASNARKWVIPGVADIDTGQASWRTDARVLNAGDTGQELTLTYYPQSDPSSPSSQIVSVAPGEILVVDDMLESLFGVTNSGGAVHIETDSISNLVATARTYDLRGDGGTFGQFVPAQVADSAVGMGDRALQILQLEQSERFRANLGLAEVDGEMAQVEITAIIPGALVAPKLLVTLQPNEFTQLNGVLEQMGITSAYNTRVSVRTVGGEGRVIGYASIVDNETQDPTYVPAQ